MSAAEELSLEISGIDEIGVSLLSLLSVPLSFGPTNYIEWHIPLMRSKPFAHAKQLYKSFNSQTSHSGPVKH